VLKSSRRRFLGRLLAASGAAVVTGWPKARRALAQCGSCGAGAQIRFAICNETFRDWSFGKTCDFVAECGYEGLEVAPFTLAQYVTQIDASRRRELRRQAETAGVEIIGLHWLLAKTEGLHLTSPDKAVRRRTAKYLGELAEFCTDLGGRLLVFGSPQQRNILPGVTRQQAINYAVEVLQRAMPAMEKTGVVLALEPLAPKETNFMTTAAEAVEVAKLVDSPFCKLHLDCKAMASESTPIPQLIRKYAKWMVHFHANDPNLQGPGFGDLDFVPIFQALVDVAYRGWVSVEVFDYTPGPERLARESIRYMERCLKKVQAG